MSAFKISDKTFFRKVKDWDKWSKEFKRLAQAYKLWDKEFQILPDEPMQSRSSSTVEGSETQNTKTGSSTDHEDLDSQSHRGIKVP